MGSCYSSEVLYLCILKKNYVHINNFQLLCQKHQIKIIEIDENNVTVSANKKQLKILKRYCRTIYSLNYPLYYPNAYGAFDMY